MSRRPDRTGKSILGIEASARADELLVREAPQIQVHFTGKGEVTTQRKGLPPEGTQSGETHRRISISTRILALHPEARGRLRVPCGDPAAWPFADR